MAYIFRRAPAWIDKVDHYAFKIRLQFWMRGECVRRTFPWNHRRLTKSEIDSLNKSDMVRIKGLPGEMDFPGPWFPRLGGWKNFAVLSRDDGVAGAVRVGWVWSGGQCMRGHISYVSAHPTLRVLLGPGEAFFFLVDEETGMQVKARLVGTGRLGDQGRYSWYPLI